MISSLIFIATMVVTRHSHGAALHSLVLADGQVLPLYKGTRFMLSSSCRLAGVRIHVEGLERVPRDRACIFMSNHVSNLDPPALISLDSRPHLGLHEALADEVAHPRHRLPPGRVHRRRPHRQPR